MLAVFIAGSLDLVWVSRPETSNANSMETKVLCQVFIVISSFMMLNMLLGILVEVVASTAEGHKRTVTDIHKRNELIAVGPLFS